MERRVATRRRFLRTAGGTAVGGLCIATGVGRTAAQSEPRLDEQWSRYSDADRYTSVAEASDGGSLVAGTLSTEDGGRGWLMKVDPDGEVRWAETYTSGPNDWLGSVIETSDGGALAVGTTDRGGDGDGLVVKTDPDGTAQWIETYGGDEADRFASAVETSDGGYLVAGRTESKGTGMGDGWVANLGADGGVRWERVMGGESNHDDVLSCVIETSDGDYLAAGVRQANLVGSGWLVKLNSDGETLWDETYGGESDVSRLPSVIETSDGGYLAAGSGQVNGDGSNDGWLLKTDRDGTLDWDQGYGDRDDALEDVVETDDGFLAVGPAEDGENAWDGWVVTAGSDGTARWDQRFDDSGQDYLASVVETGDGGYLVAGETRENGSVRGWLLKLGPVDASTTSGPGANRETPTDRGTSPADDDGGEKGTTVPGDTDEESGTTGLLPVALGALGLGGGGLWLYARRGDGDDGSGDPSVAAAAGGTASTGEPTGESPSGGAPGGSDAAAGPASPGDGSDTDDTDRTAAGETTPESPAPDADAGAQRDSQVPESIPSPPDLSVEYDAFTDEEPVGSGGNADVTRVTVATPSGDVPLAIKKPRMSGTIHAEDVDRLLDEAETWNKLDDHDHVVSVVDYDSQPVPWIAMEYMDGGDLRDRADGMSIDQKLWTAIAITEGVNHAHRRGVAHLDLKPANVLFRTVEGSWAVPKVSDWGLSKRLLDHSESVEGFSPQYAAPEQFTDDDGSADDVTDVYQLGALFYALFTGRPPFDGDAAEVMYQVLNDEPTPPSEIADVPAQLDEILLTALATEKGDRYDGVLLLRNALRDVSDGL